MEEIVVQQSEQQVIKKAYSSIPFPAVTVRDTRLYFNRFARKYFPKRNVAISTAGELIIFRPTDERGSFRLNRHSGGSIYVSSAKLIRSMPLKTGSAYQLYAVKGGGGYAINAYHPLEN